jgi:hypothetical protein
LLTAVFVGEIVVYTSLDQVFSEPILKDFERQTGIQVKPVYDVEATKSTGMVNRLIAERLTLAPMFSGARKLDELQPICSSEQINQ